MEPFRLDRQAKVFLAALVVLALALVPLAPFASLAFGALSLVVLGVVFLISLARNRRFFGPLTPVEGALAASAAVFALSGALVVVYAILMLGGGNAMMLSHSMLPFSSAWEGSRPVGSSSRHYGDPETRDRFKLALKEAGIPFRIENRDGKEFVAWTQEHNDAVEAIHEKVSAGPLPAGRSVRFGDSESQKQFAEWLERKGFKARTIQAYGEEYLAWDDDAGDVRALMEEFMAERANNCKRKTARIDRGQTPNC